MLGDGVFTATLVERPSMMSRTRDDVVLEIDAGVPMQVDPPSGLGTEVVEASPEEWARLDEAGYTLAKAT